MQQIKSVLTQASFRPFSAIKPVSAKEYNNAENPDRRWEIVFTYSKNNNKYLTDEERRYFLEELARGKTMVQIGSLTLTNRFLYIAPIRDKRKEINYELVEVNGKQVYKELE